MSKNQISKHILLDPPEKKDGLLLLAAKAMNCDLLAGHFLLGNNQFGSCSLDRTYQARLVVSTSGKLGGLGWWFGFLGSPFERHCYWIVTWWAPLESQTNNPNQLFTISWWLNHPSQQNMLQVKLDHFPKNLWNHQTWIRMCWVGWILHWWTCQTQDFP